MGLIFGTLLSVLAIFLILLVLVQRGRGGGLTGALGGMGGSSAFGAKAGDVFTRITIVTASIWICVCAAALYWANNKGDRLGANILPSSLPTQTAPAGSSTTPPASGDAAKTETNTPAVETSAPASSETTAPQDSSAPDSSADPARQE